MHVLVEPKTLQGGATSKLLLKLRLLVRVTPVPGRDAMKAYPFSADCGPASLEQSRREFHTLRAKWSAKARIAEDLWEDRELLSNVVLKNCYAATGYGDSAAQFRALAKAMAE